MTDQTSSSLRFRLFGPLDVVPEHLEIDLGPHKQLAVLTVLLLQANEVVSTDRIIDRVWGESPPRTAGHSVQVYVSDLRRSLSDLSRNDLIETRTPGYVLHVPPDTVDIFQFERLVRDGMTAVRTGDISRGQPKLESAIALWIGDPLADFEYEAFAQGHIRTLRELRTDAMEALAGVALDQGDTDGVRRLAQDAIGSDPLREEPRRLMMLALYGTGRQAEALRHFGEYHDLLGQELAIEPSENLHDLEERILLQDPTLALSVSPVTEGNPYRGLQPFSEDDADVYFGRESLVAEALETLDRTRGFVPIVGPSGSGKSSAARAGMIPVLRAAGETVVVFQPGSRPLWELAGALDRAGLGSRADLFQRFETDPKALISVVGRPLVLVVDQFEELFTLAEPDAAVRFAELIASAVRDSGTPLRIVATLRADYYDRPLSLPSLAGPFSESVVSVKPMTPLELERAVVEPAKSAGVDVEPALLVQLVSDMGDEPGALPLLQFTLFELYERTSNGLMLADYESLGGLHGALTGGADQLMHELDSDGRELVEQVMMRMVQKGQTTSTARPVALRKLLDLGVDRVSLQRVLEAFGTRRLLTFDRDASGAAVVEMAHEYLISEWPKLVRWIEEHSEDLDQLSALDTAAAEWSEADRSHDYLLRGERLERFEHWREETSLRLTTTETEFMDASLEQRRREEEARSEQLAKEESLAKRARRRLWAFGAAVALLAAAVTFLVIALTPPPPPDVVVWWSGQNGANYETIFAGFDAAAADFGIEVAEFTVHESQVAQVEAPIRAGAKLVFLQTLVLDFGEATRLIQEYPETLFVDLDTCALVGPPNVTCISADQLQLSFLAGATAGLVTESGRVGFVGGVDMDVIHIYESGFRQGVEWVDRGITIDAVYLTRFPDFSGFTSPPLADIAAEYLLSRGVDVVFHAAALSGIGVYRSFAEASDASGAHYWVIGPDADDWRFVAVRDIEIPAEDVEKVQAHVLTSIVKRFDLGIYWTIEHFVETGEVVNVALDIENGGVDYVTSGGNVEPWIEGLERAKEAVTSGSVQLEILDLEERDLVKDVVGP